MKNRKCEYESAVGYHPCEAMTQLSVTILRLSSSLHSHLSTGWLAPPSSCVHGVSRALHLGCVLTVQGGQEELQGSSTPQVFSEAQPMLGGSLPALPKLKGAEEGPRQTLGP